jgi:hypothetical protein
VNTRSRPHTTLSINVRTPGGAITRLGDDRSEEPQKIPKGLTFSTAMPGGFTTANWTMPRPARLGDYDIPELSEITILGTGGQVAWQGRIEKLPDTGGYEASLSPEAFGYQSALEDNNSAREIFIDQELSSWEGPTLARKIARLEAGETLTAASVGVAPASLNPALTTATTGPLTGHQAAEGWYDAKGIPIGKLVVAYKCGHTVGSSTSWFIYAAITSSETDTEHTGSILEKHSTTQEYAGKVQAEFTTEQRPWALVRANYSEAGGSSEEYPIYWPRLVVYGCHGLTLQSTEVTIVTGRPTEAQGLLASEVVGYAIAKWAPELTYTAGSEGTIRPTTFAIPQLVFKEPTTVAEMVKQATRFELPDWAVWESKTFYMYPRPTPESSAPGGEKWQRWKTRVGPSQLQEAGPQISRLWNGVIVSYTDVTGQQRYVGPPYFSGAEPGTESASLEIGSEDNPLNELGIKKWALLTMGTSTREGATKVGEIFLREQQNLELSGQVSLVGHVENEAGTWCPAWEVRAGDQIAIVDSHSPGWRRIVSTTYDDTTKTLTAQLEQPPDSMQALLERLSASITGIGAA